MRRPSPDDFRLLVPLAVVLVAAACGPAAAGRSTEPVHRGGSTTPGLPASSTTSTVGGRPTGAAPTSSTTTRPEAGGSGSGVGSGGPPGSRGPTPVARPPESSAPSRTTSPAHPSAHPPPLHPPAPPPPPVTTTTAPPTPSTTVPATSTTVPAAGQLAIRNFTFLPSTLVVTAGTTVTVTNHDAVGHTWTSTTGEFDSGPLADGASYSHTFAVPGTYHYRCSVHPSMVGTIVVG